MAGKVCQICGENAGIYPLCKTHLKMKDEGLVVKNVETNKWELIEHKPSWIKEESISNCLLCNEEISSKYKFCKECYYNIEQRKEELDKNKKAYQLKDYYYNAKDYANRIYDESKIYYQQLTMVAISQLLNDLHNDNSLLNERLEEDINKINVSVKNKNEKLNLNIKEQEKREEVKKEKDNSKAKTLQSQDGHFLESELEVTVDDILYGLHKVHAYSIKVDEIFERTVICDWFVPVIGDTGIYIELWGVVGDNKYDKNKKEKIELYKKDILNLLILTIN